jgi:shikimate kinase
VKNIVLTGFMASGKTTVGMSVAKKLNLMFYDTDKIIEEQEGKTIPEIFSEFGEKYFRELENKLAINLKNIENAVIATGGGFVINPQNIELMRQNGVIVNLKTTPEIIERRMNVAKSTRPLLQTDSIEEVLDRFNNRKIYYNNNDICIKLTEEMSIEECSDLVINAYEQFTIENN